jgi:hypothetical protein
VLHLNFAREAAGALGTRLFPAPSDFRERDIDGKTRAKHAARSRSCILPSLRANGSRECAPDDKHREAIHFAAQRKNGLLRFARNDGGNDDVAV